MTPRLETQRLSIDPLESELILSEFLHELDEIDHLQDAELMECIDSKRRRELDVDTKPERKKIKTTTASNTPSTSHDTPKPLTRKRRSTSWLRRKQELNALRTESEALETRVAFLQMECDRRKTYQQSLPAVPTGQGMWQSVAIIARQECQTAQDENASLKGMLRMYARASEMLQAQLIEGESRRQHLLDSSTAFADAFRVGMIRTRRLCFENSKIFDMLETRINDRYHEVDSIIRESRRQTTEGTTEHVRVCREDGQDAAAVEFKHVRLLPFGEDATAKTIWEIIELGGEVTKTNTFVARSSSNMVGMVSRHTVPLGDKASVSAEVHTVIKRFAVAAGMVAFIESRSEWSIHNLTSDVLRSTTEEGGWILVHKYPLKACSSGGGATQQASQLRTSVKLRPNEFQATGNAKSFTSTMVDVVIPSFRDILSSHLQSVDNFLLDSERTVRG